MRIDVYNQNNVTLRVFFNLKLREKIKLLIKSGMIFELDLKTSERYCVLKLDEDLKNSNTIEFY